MISAYAVRLSPLGGETQWSLEDGALVETRGKSRNPYPLAALSRMTLIPAQASRPHPSLVLRFGGRRRLTIPAASFGPRGVEQRTAAFSDFARGVAAQGRAAAPTARFVLAGSADRRSPIVWAIVLLSTGAAGLGLTAFSSVTGGLGLSLAAWLAFAALVLAAVLPWLKAADRDFDPLSIPESILPR